MARVLIIGYGNRLRTDDGAGQETAERLAAIYRHDPDVRVLASHQLNPEMAKDMAESDFVLLLDADAGGVPGTIRRVVHRQQDCDGFFTHHNTPDSLLAAAGKLYGHVPEAVSLTLSAESFELGTELSPTIRGRLEELITAAKQLVAHWQESAAEVSAG